MDEEEFDLVVSGPQNYDEILEAARNGDMSLAVSARRLLRESRASVLKSMNQDLAPFAQHTRTQLLVESRLWEDELNGALRAIQDEKHAEQMVTLGSAANEIAQAANATAARLKASTTGLFWATVVLAIATLGLLVATVILVVAQP